MKLTKKHSKKNKLFTFLQFILLLDLLAKRYAIFFFVLFFSNFCFTKFYNFYVLYEGNAEK